MVKVGVASDSKLLEWFHNPRDTSSPRFVSPSLTLSFAFTFLRLREHRTQTVSIMGVFESYIIL